MGISQIPQAIVPAAFSSAPTGASSSVTTRQTTTTQSFTDLTTSGPAVTLTTGTKALVIVTVQMDNNNVSGSGAESDFAVSGASTRSAASDSAIKLGDGVSASTAGGSWRFSSATYLTNLTAGSNTFTVKYRSVGGGTTGFQNRSIFVMDMGS